MDGLKTGYTSEAGYCLTATGKWKDMRIISVVMGEESQEARTNDTVALLNYGKSTYKLNTIISKDKVLGKVDIELGENLSTDIVIKDNAVDLVKINDKEQKYTYKINTNKLVAPVKKGDVIGRVEIYGNDELIMTSDLTVKKDEPKCSLWTLFKRMLSLVVIGINN